jgi:hypothetical protein
MPQQQHPAEYSQDANNEFTHTVPLNVWAV